MLASLPRCSEETACDRGGLDALSRPAVNFVPPLEPLTVRVISPRFLAEDERVQIADLASRGHGPTAIGQQLGRAPSTIRRKLRRSLHSSAYDRPLHAHATAAARRRRAHSRKLVADPGLKANVLGRLRERWSSQQISRALRLAHPREPARRVARLRRSIRRSTARAPRSSASRQPRRRAPAGIRHSARSRPPTAAAGPARSRNGAPIIDAIVPPRRGHHQ